jgi:hypothetical protein
MAPHLNQMIKAKMVMMTLMFAKSSKYGNAVFE